MFFISLFLRATFKSANITHFLSFIVSKQIFKPSQTAENPYYKVKNYLTLFSTSLISPPSFTTPILFDYFSCFSFSSLLSTGLDKLCPKISQQLYILSRNLSGLKKQTDWIHRLSLFSTERKLDFHTMGVISKPIVRPVETCTTCFKCSYMELHSLVGCGISWGTN